jgi:hypothetical protein
MLDLPIDEPKHRTTTSKRDYSGPGLRSDSVPATVSRVTVRALDRLAGEQRAVELVAGVVAVAQTADGALCPVAGWHVEPATARIDEVAEQIVREHRATPAPEPGARHLLRGPTEVIALYSRIDSATLFDGERAWRLRPPREHDFVDVERGGHFSIQRIADLPASRSLCAATKRGSDEPRWLLCRLDNPGPHEIDVVPRHAAALDDPSEIRVLAGPLAAILEVALSSEGDIAHLEIARFDQLLGTCA